MLTFASPWVFLLLILPLLPRYLLPAAKIEQQSGLRFAFFAQVSQLPTSDDVATRLSFLRTAVACLIWLLLIIAAAGPRWLGEPVAIPQTGRDLLLAVDLSGSMELPDMEINGKKINRLQAIKYIAQDFINKRQGDRMGLILFGTRAYLRTPLTYDRQTVNAMLQDASISLAGPKTAIGDAIGLAIKQLLKQPESSRILILLTDGANNSGHVAPIEAAKLAAKNNIKIYTIGFGADRMMVPGVFGQRQINPSADLDETTLQQIADLTGGHYFRAKDTGSLQAIYAQLNKIEPISTDQIVFRPIHPLYPWPLGTALLISVCLALSRIRFPFKRDS